MDELTKEQVIKIGQEVMASQATILSEMANRLSNDFVLAVKLIHDVGGKIVISGIGK